MAVSCKHVRELASGFVLGALDPDEMNAVRDHLITCDKNHTEFDDLGGVVSYLATTVEPMEPPAWLRESVLAAAAADLRARKRTEHVVKDLHPAPIANIGWAAAGTEIIPFAQPAVVRTRRLRDRVPSWLTQVAAAVAVLALVGYAAIVQAGFYNPHGQPAYDKVLNAAAQLDSLSVQLTPVGDTSSGGLVVLRPTGHVYCYVRGMAATSGDQAYVVWLSLDSAPLTKAGTMTIDGSGRGLLEYDEATPSSTLQVQITREARADVTKPAGSVVVGGTISLYPNLPAARPF